MSIYIPPKSILTSQPQSAPILDGDSLIRFNPSLFLNPAGNSIENLVTKRNVTQNGTDLSYPVTQDGIAYRLNQSGTTTTFQTTDFTVSSAYSILFIARPSAVDDGYSNIYNIFDSGGSGRSQIRYTSSEWLLYQYNGSWTGHSLGSYTADQRVIFAVTWNGTTLKVWRNGVLVINAAQGLSETLTGIAIGSDWFGGNPYNATKLKGDLELFVGSSIAWDDASAVSLSENPWQLFSDRPSNRIFYFDAVTGTTYYLNLSSTVTETADDIKQISKPWLITATETVDDIKRINKPWLVTATETADDIKQIRKPWLLSSIETADDIKQIRKPWLLSSIETADDIKQIIKPWLVTATETADDIKRINKPWLVTATETVDDIKQISKPWLVTSNTIIDDIKQIRKSWLVTATETVDDIKQIIKPWLVTSTETVEITKQTLVNILYATISATSTGTANLIKQISKPWLVTSNTIIDDIKQIRKSLLVTSNTTIDDIKQISKPWLVTSNTIIDDMKRINKSWLVTATETAQFTRQTIVGMFYVAISATSTGTTNLIKRVNKLTMTTSNNSSTFIKRITTIPKQVTSTGVANIVKIVYANIQFVTLAVVSQSQARLIKRVNKLVTSNSMLTPFITSVTTTLASILLKLKPSLVNFYLTIGADFSETLVIKNKYDDTLDISDTVITAAMKKSPFFGSHIDIYVNDINAGDGEIEIYLNNVNTSTLKPGQYYYSVNMYINSTHKKVRLYNGFITVRY